MSRKKDGKLGRAEYEQAMGPLELELKSPDDRNGVVKKADKKADKARAAKQEAAK